MNSMLNTITVQIPFDAVLKAALKESVSQLDAKTVAKHEKIVRENERLWKRNDKLRQTNARLNKSPSNTIRERALNARYYKQRYEDLAEKFNKVQELLNEAYRQGVKWGLEQAAADREIDRQQGLFAAVDAQKSAH